MQCLRCSFWQYNRCRYCYHLPGWRDNFHQTTQCHIPAVRNRSTFSLFKSLLLSLKTFHNSQVMVSNGSSDKTVSELNLLSTTPLRLSREKKDPAENRIPVLRSSTSITRSYAGSRRKDSCEWWRGRNLERRDRVLS